MSNDDDFGFAPPPFDADAALVTLKRALRDMKLAERGNAYELRGKRVVGALERGFVLGGEHREAGGTDRIAGERFAASVALLLP